MMGSPLCFVCATIRFRTRTKRMNSNAKHKKLRVAYALNLLLPGAGQLYLGRAVLGGIYMAGFVLIFVTMLARF
jgi:TM2 domain-containing membrane protein YozV